MLDLAGISKEKISRKNRPTFLTICDEKISKISPQFFNENFDDFSLSFEKEFRQIEVSSLKDLAENLRNFNTDLNDQTFVYCSDGSPESPELKHAIRLIRSETKNPILLVRDLDLAEKMRMKPGVFYCYYKPSYVNGFGQFVGQTIDFPYLQAFEGVCRDEF